MKRKKVAPLLKKMEIGDQEEYPYRQFSSLKTTIERIQVETKDMKKPKKFSYKSLEKSIIVTRIP